MFNRRSTRLAAIVMLAHAVVVCAAPVTVRTVDIESLVVDLRSFSLTGGLRAVDANGKDIAIPAEDVVSLRTGAEASTPTADAATVRLVDGHVLFGRIESGNEESIRIALTGLESIDVPLVQVTGLVPPNSASQNDRRGRQRDQTQPDVDDVVILANGDRLAGGIVRMDGDAVTLDTTSGEMSIGYDRVAELRLAMLMPPSDGRLRVRLTLTDGSTVEAVALEWTSDGITARIYSNESVAIPPEQLLRVEVRGGRWQWLSDLEPSRYEHTPFLALDWPWQRDANVLGRPMRVNGLVHERGIGVHSCARLVYELEGRYRTFLSRFGLDDSAGPLANVDVEVRVDGQSRFRKTNVARTSENAAEQPVRIDVQGAARLELFVDFGRNGDVQDRFNWAGAALIR